MEVNQVHDKILGVLGEKGPSLPINLAKALDMSSLFISAFLSELYNQKRIKMSHLKVGGSHLYFLDGQEELLEPYYKYMHPKEAEGFLLLKKNKILKDVDQEPAMRVALRSIRDFAVGFKVGEEIYWRYILVPEMEVNRLIGGEKIGKEKDFKKETSKRPIISKENVVGRAKSKSKKLKPKSEFVLRVIDFINRNGLKIIEENECKVKEFNGIIQIRSELGTMNFLTQAKDKRIISETDLIRLLSDAKSSSLPAFILYTGEISKKAKDFLRKHDSMFKAKRID